MNRGALAARGESRAALPRMRPLLALVSALLVGCATTSPQESALRDLRWSAATDCARNSATITVTDVDSFGRVHYSLWQGGKQDVPAFEKCYQERLRQDLARRPDLAEYARSRAKPAGQ